LGDTLVLKPVPDATGSEMDRKHADTFVQLFFLERFAFMPYVSDSVGIHIAMKRETQHEDPDGAYPARSTRQHRPQDWFLMVVGLPSKQVGSELRISEITVKAHRGNVKRKMKAKSLAELVSIATRLRLTRTSGSALPPAR
jgi:hypothetical protein